MERLVDSGLRVDDIALRAIVADLLVAKVPLVFDRHRWEETKVMGKGGGKEGQFETPVCPFIYGLSGTG